MYIYIRAMSESQIEIYRKISDVSGELASHIIKLILYPHAQEVNHWKKEVYAFLNRVPKLRNTKKLPKASLILKGLQVYNDMVDSLIYQVTESEKDLVPVDVSEEYVLNALVSYQRWLANELSTKLIVVSKDVYKILSQVTGCD